MRIERKDGKESRQGAKIKKDAILQLLICSFD